MADTRPIEELYNLELDPWELNNLAHAPSQQKRLRAFRGMLSQWELETMDQGRVAEDTKMYDSDMKPYVERVRRTQPEKAKTIERNIALMKRWQQAGK